MAKAGKGPEKRGKGPKDKKTKLKRRDDVEPLEFRGKNSDSE